MPKGRKQKTTVRKKKKKSGAQKGKPIARKRKKSGLLLESIEEQVAPDMIAVEGDIAAGIEEDALRVEDFADVSQERASIISIVKGLEGQVETAFKLKEVLEVELDTTQKRLAEELDARAQLETQITSLDAQAALAGRLREDIAFVEEDRNKFADRLARIQTQLETVTEERDKLAELIASAESHAKEIEGEKIAFEAQVMNLKDKITDTDRLRKEIMEITEARQGLNEQVHELTRRLEASETSRNALETKLAGTHQNTKTLREEAEKLRAKIAKADNRTADLRIQLENQQGVNQDLIKANARLENEIKKVTINCEAAKGELDAFKNALRDIRSEAARTSGRVRQKYLKPASAKR
jgi:chromosome segregation ATPase